MRRVMLVTHAGRPEAIRIARRMARALAASGIGVQVPEHELAPLQAGEDDVASQALASGDETLPCTGTDSAVSCELVIVIGGDGTILRAAQYAVAESIPLLGVNLGHVGFLAEVESDDVEHLVSAVVDRSYRVEERLALKVNLLKGADLKWSTWALNEASIEKASRKRMIDVVLEIDDRPLSRWGCDGVVVSSPTGSTAYAWSSGGPVVWPAVQALVVAPISAHALFARSLVVAPDSKVAVELLPASPEGVIWCDGRRHHDLEPGSRVEITRADDPLKFARLHEARFTDRLVAKFGLPVEGWRGKRAFR
ncbi:MAG: NAD kinase [Candidatus Nanopelagicales bacterium]|nr:NAD kinase [Candidatus Nanopelagicales bacterium]